MATTLRESLEDSRKYYQSEAYRYHLALEQLARDIPELLDLEADSVSGSEYSIYIYDTQGEHPGLGSQLLALSDDDHVDYIVQSSGYIAGTYHIKGVTVRHYNAQVEQPCYKAVIQQEVTWCGDCVPDGKIIEWLQKPGDDDPE